MYFGNTRALNPTASKRVVRPRYAPTPTRPASNTALCLLVLKATGASRNATNGTKRIVLRRRKPPDCEKRRPDTNAEVIAYAAATPRAHPATRGLTCHFAPGTTLLNTAARTATSKTARSRGRPRSPKCLQLELKTEKAMAAVKRNAGSICRQRYAARGAPPRAPRFLAPTGGHLAPSPVRRGTVRRPRFQRGVTSGPSLGQAAPRRQPLRTRRFARQLVKASPTKRPATSPTNMALIAKDWRSLEAEVALARTCDTWLDDWLDW